VISDSKAIEMADETALNQQRLVVKLEENAMDSLVHGVEHHLYGRRKTDWKYVILHIFHAVELFLKARLAKHDEALIYRNRKNGNTVGSDEAIDLLVREVKLSLFRYAERQESGKYRLGGALDALRKARNAIEHKEVALKPDEVKEFLGAAFVFLDTFVSEELGLSLKTELDALDEAREEELLEDGVEVDDLESQNTYRTLSMAYLFYIQHMWAKGIPILDPKEKWDDYQYFTCEMCDEEAIAVPDPTSKHLRIAHCFNCLAEYTVHYCIRCEQSYISFLKEWEKQVDVSSYPDWVNSVVI
jgi:transcription elongation factor Elf1